MGFIDWIRGLFGKLNKETVPSGVLEKEFGARPAASREMQDNAALWYAMYTDKAPWLNCDIRSIGLPSSIGRELSRHALTEFSVTVSGSARANFINDQVQLAARTFWDDLEKGLCLGGIAFKPYNDNGRILVQTYTSGFTPTHFDGAGKAIGGVFKSKPVRQGNEWYVRLEYHDFRTLDDGSSVYVVENKAFRSSQDGSVGAQAALGSVDIWRGLSERELIAGLDGPLFAYFKPPVANHEEIGSPMGCSVYSGAVKELIKQADEQWERLWWEFKSGERKIFSDATQIDASQISDRLFLKGAFTSEGNLFEQFSPDFRNDSLYQGLQYILKLIEFSVGLAFGTISDPQSVNKTATEEIMTKHRQYVTEDAIQKAFQSTLDDLICAMNAWCDLLRLAPAGAYKVDYNWGDGVLDDPETRRQDMALDMQRVAAGLMRDVDFVMKWDKVDEATARKLLPGMEEMTTEPEEEIE